MADKAGSERDLSARRIIGFACNQAFIFLSILNAEGVGLPFEQHSLLWPLLFMAVGFAVLLLLSPASLNRLLSRPLLYLYVVCAGCGSLVPLFGYFSNPAGAIACGLLVGVPDALLLTAWGRSFDQGDSRDSVPEVFLGSLVAALLCLVFSVPELSAVVAGAVCLLPLAGVVNMDTSRNASAPASASPIGANRSKVSSEEVAPGARKSGKESSAQAGKRSGGFFLSLDEMKGVVTTLSAKILCGTFLFGVAAGLLMVSRAISGLMTASDYRVSMVIYAAFVAGGLTLLLSDGFGRGAALNKSYRLAVFVMMMGVLLAPWPLFESSIMPGESVAVAGFLGLTVVLVSLFLVLAEIAGVDCARSFSAGFLALSAGGLVGAAVAALVGTAASSSPAPYVLTALAGAIILVSYIFLFTEGDFNALTQLVSESDSFEEACARIAERYALSNREAEILAFALRGRTSERIAQELVISKSTVDTHLRRIYAKCGVHSRQELIDLME